jgi:hypothetical protein
VRGSAGSGKVIAKVAGVLFITATAASLLSTSLLNPVLNGSGYLATGIGAGRVDAVSWARVRSWW